MIIFKADLDTAKMVFEEYKNQQEAEIDRKNAKLLETQEQLKVPNFIFSTLFMTPWDKFSKSRWQSSRDGGNYNVWSWIVSRPYRCVTGFYFDNNFRPKSKLSRRWWFKFRFGGRNKTNDPAFCKLFYNLIGYFSKIKISTCTLLVQVLHKNLYFIRTGTL